MRRTALGSTPVNAAFKEWAVVVDALGRGNQIIILRKGGISEGKGGFKLEHQEFLLFPTLYHQQREGVIPSAQTHYDQLPAAYRDPDQVRIEFVAHVVEALKVNDLSAAQRLESQHIWTPKVIEERFDWGREQAIFAIAIRISRLPQPIDLPIEPSYGGCKSWIQLTHDISESEARPALSDAAFAEKLNAFRHSLCM